jgi:RHS repeat-associated protein
VGTDVPVAASVALRYHYDAYGRVVGRTLNPGPSEASQYFIYDNDRIVQELNGSGALVAEWVYGTYIDEILAMFRDTDGNGSLDATYYYLQDDLYNVVALADATGAVVERYTYDDYGAPSFFDGAGNPISGSQYGNPFLFTGRRWDEVLGLYDYRTRYYNPELGRFIGMDVLGPWGDNSNLGNAYAYVGNNPWSTLDPFGEAAKDVDYNTIVKVQEVVDEVLKMPVPKGRTAQSAGTYLHKQLQTKLDALGNVILLTEAAIDETGTIVKGRPANSVVPDVMFVVLKKGQSAQNFVNGSKSLRGHVDAILDLKTGTRGLRSSWTNELTQRLGLQASDIIEAKKGSNLVSLFGVISEGTESKRLGAKLARKTGNSVAKMVPIAGALLAYKVARAQGWSQDDALAYAAASVVNADIAVDVAIFAQDSFKRSAEAYAAGYEDMYVEYLNDALDKMTQVRGHEEGAHRGTEKLNVILDRNRGNTTRAGDVHLILGE